MSEFYRYLRPQQFNIQRNAIEALPNGGVCIHASALCAWPGDKRLFLGISVCDKKDLFNRSVAKRKAEMLSWCITPKSFSAEDIINELLEKPYQSTLCFAPGLAPEDYLWDELMEFKAAIEWIRETKKQAKQFQQDHHDSVKALQLGERYNELQS